MPYPPPQQFAPPGGPPAVPHPGAAAAPAAAPALPALPAAAAPSSAPAVAAGGSDAAVASAPTAAVPGEAELVWADEERSMEEARAALPRYSLPGRTVDGAPALVQ
jgi:hypothetical protein